ncbi:hypothetical protein [Chondromyces crocatus]|uniref:Uncharacterized protein n=1 Tax=Chondromyces crocatus TaxID=52 RepID=A0A0K1E7M7_CHOCO|nr:hypothetical protein [Chondromyces crocatus]AKT36891.1 uncharacterized protein CMC5_010120 [Chondromyces crocatus]
MRAPGAWLLAVCTVSVVSAASVGCDGEAPPAVSAVATAERLARVASGEVAAVRTSASLAAGAPVVVGEPGPAHLASRCGDCHGSIHGGWSRSGHARSNQGALYLAMRSKSEPVACDPCHAPLRSILPPGDMLAEEGVTCDACHMLRDVELGPTRAKLTLLLSGDKRWGTLCDAQDHYFHTTGCSPLFKESKLCAGCHQWSTRAASGEPLPVLKEYDDWLASPAAAAGKSCQGCHMPAVHGEVATGWTRRASVGSHELLGESGALRRGAVRLTMQVEENGQALRAEVSLTNTNEAHAAPTGFPGRQLALELTLLDAAEQKLSRSARVFGRVLVDEAGREVPFYAAQAQGSDNRIGPGQTRREVFTFDRGAAVSARARVVWRAMSPAVASALGVSVEEQVLAESKVPLRRGQGSRRAP